MQQIQRIPMRETRLSELGMDIVTVEQLRAWQRESAAEMPHRLPFYAIVMVTQGEMRYQADFQDYRAGQGEVCQFNPQQVSFFNLQGEWDAQVVRFVPEFLLPTSHDSDNEQLLSRWQELSSQWQPKAAEYRLIQQQIQLLQESLRLSLPLRKAKSLLRHQLYSLLNLLVLSVQSQENHRDSKRLARFKAFSRLLEQQFKRQHSLAYYANALACTERSLTWASLDAVGLTAKAFISQRLLLEAKRLLVYTRLPISQIADQLGFGDSAAFRKFFHHQTGESGAGFRRKHGV